MAGAAEGDVIMAKSVKAIVIAGNGTNCEREVATACELAGAECDIVHIAELLAGRARLNDYHFLNLAGGFLDGDDLGSAKAGANRLKQAAVRDSSDSLADQVQRFISDGKLVMGVCNGFQLMAKMGLLPALDGDYHNQSVTLTFNDRGRFEDRWCYLKVDRASPCVFTRGLDGLYLPVRHGEGKFVVQDDATLEQIEAKHLSAVKYCAADYHTPVMDYPMNPNGSVAAIAGICDETGRLFGLMPHPEAYLHRTHHPRWTRETDLPEEGMGLWLYRNAVKYVREELL
jgi:phosphoribosylformylglycinamidine synthase